MRCVYRTSAPDVLRVGVVGLGHVGTISAACLADEGHEIWGVDINRDRLQLFAEGRPSVGEPGLGVLLKSAHAKRKLHTVDVFSDTLIAKLDLVLICIGTPKRDDDELDLAPLLEILRTIGACLNARPRSSEKLMIVIRSTLQPGSLEQRIVPAMIEAASEPPGERYEVVYNPEFLREATAIADYRDPSKIVIGERKPGAARRLLGLYHRIDAPIFETSYINAEMIKLANNAFHAAKVAFGNEIGRLCHANGADAQTVTDMLLIDTKHDAYLRPGGPFGGSCLPKDVASLAVCSRRMGRSLPLIESLLPSNLAHLAHLTELVRNAVPAGELILLLGLSFKAGTDDLRESPLVHLAKNLIRCGYRLRIFDPDVCLERLSGENLALVAEHRKILDLKYDDLQAAFAEVKYVVLGKRVTGMETYLPFVQTLLDVDRLC